MKTGSLRRSTRNGPGKGANLVRAAIYCRVSTEEQAAEGMSIAAQKKALIDYGAKHGMIVVDEFIDEGVSARTADRPQFQRMVSAAKKRPKPFDIILIHKTDRFARNREDAIIYKSLLRRDCDIDVRSVTEQFEDSPTGKLLEGIMEVMAEFYSLNLSQEVLKGMKEKASYGKGLGMTPLGYRLSDSGQFEIMPEEAAVVRFIFNTYLNEEEGLLAIAHRLHTEGIARFGSAGAKFKWSSVGIRNIIKNPAYIGTLVWNRRDGNKKGRIRNPEDWIVVENAHEPIIGQETFDRANQLLKSRHGVKTPVEDFMLRGMVRCADCGGGMAYYRMQWRRKSGEKVVRPHLSCSRYHHSRTCYFNHVPIADVEQAIFVHLAGILYGLVSLEQIEITFPHMVNIQSEAEVIRRQLAATEVKFQRQMEAYEAGAIGLEDLKAARERVNAEREELLRRLGQVEAKLDATSPAFLGDLQDRIRELVGTVTNDEMPPAERRHSLKQVVDHLAYSRREDQLRIVMGLASTV
jgi:site-specific DNA recombinase